MATEVLGCAVDREELSARLRSLEPVIQKNRLRPEAECVLVASGEDGLSLSVASETMSATVRLERFTECEPFRSLVPAGRLAAMVGAMVGEPVRLVPDGSSLRLSCGGTKYRLPGYPPGGFLEPSLVTSHAATATVGQVSMRRLIGATLFAAGSNTLGLPSGLLFEADGFEFRVVATDGRVFATATADGVCDVRGRHGVIVPPKAAAALVRLLGDDDGDVEVRFGSGHAEFHCRGAVLRTSLVAGAMPKYLPFLERPPGTRITVSADALASAMQRVGLTIDDKLPSGAVVTISDDGSVTMRSASQDAGDSVVEMVTSGIEGSAAEFCVQPVYVLSPLRAAAAGEADISVDVGHKNYIRIVLGNGTLYTIGKTTMPRGVA